MSRLAGISLLIGAVSGMISIYMVLFPAAAKIFLQAFPRNRMAGTVIACIALGWAAVLLMRMNMGFLEEYKPLLLIIAPLSLVLVVFFVDDLLAPRALGGLFLLIPAPLLDSARWLDSAWRYFAVIAAYIMVIKGIVMVLNPYLFRKWTLLFLNTASRVRYAGFSALSVSLIWIFLAFTVYR